MEKPPNIGLLLNENFGCFILYGSYVIDDFFMQIIDNNHSVPIICIEATLRPTLSA